MPFELTPKQFFVAVALILGGAIAVATSVSQASFFRQAIIERESRIIDDVVDAAALGTSPIAWSPADYRDAAAQKDMTRRFSLLQNLPGVVLVKVFNRDRTIIWSTDPSLIGTSQTRHPEDLQRALNGEVRTEFNHIEQIIYAVLHVPEKEPLIEFYVPFAWTSAVLEDVPGDGVVALYRSPKELNRTIFHGLLWLWFVTAVGGGILIFAIYSLYKAVYNRQREVELEFARFAQEHGRIIQLEKLSAIGRMVTEIAHQLNNPLVGVVNLADLATREADNPDRVRELLRDIRNAGKLCSDFVQRTLQLNAASQSQPKPTSMALIVNDTVAFCRQTLGKGPAIETKLPASDIVAEIDPVLLRHALFNLLHNAAQADPHGTVTVTLSRQPRSDVDGCLLTVEDGGPGIPAETAGKLFTPFFTTHPNGTGLGLPVAQQIVLKHHGVILAGNRPEGGALFSVWLPIAPAAAATGDAGAP
jgi:signal transduction histidine kinase